MGPLWTIHDTSTESLNYLPILEDHYKSPISKKSSILESDASIEDDDTSSIRRHHPAAGFSSSAVNLLKTILGAGILAMPSAFANVGYIPGTLFLFIAATLAGFGVHLYVICSYSIGRGATFHKLAAVTYPKLSLLFDLAIAVKCFGVAISYLIVIGDTMPSLVIGLGIENSYLISRHFWIFASMFLLGPLAFLKRMDSLKYTSFAGVLSVFYLLFVAVWNFTKPDAHIPPEDAGIEPIANLSISAFKSFSVFVFSFTCHQNIFPIQREARDDSPKFINKVILFCIYLSAILYFIFSMVSYANFGQIVQGNVFKNYPTDRREMVLARLLFALLSAFSYPLQTLPCRMALEHILPFSRTFHTKHSKRIHRILTMSILSGTFIAAWHFENLALVSGIIGTLASIPICYILPFVFYNKLHSQEGWGRKRTMAAGLAAFGVLAMIFSAISIIFSFILP